MELVLHHRKFEVHKLFLNFLSLLYCEMEGVHLLLRVQSCMVEELQQSEGGQTVKGGSLGNLVGRVVALDPLDRVG